MRKIEKIEDEFDTLGYEEEGEASASRVNRSLERLAKKINEIIEELNKIKLSLDSRRR